MPFSLVNIAVTLCFKLTNILIDVFVIEYNWQSCDYNHS